MRTSIITIAVLCCLLCACGEQEPAEPQDSGVVQDSPAAPGTAPDSAEAVSGQPRLTAAYPATRRVEQVDEQFGVAVADPYRWLEADVRESPEVAAWVESQNALTFDYLDTLPSRERIHTRLRELWNYERFGIPVHRGSRYFYRRNDGLQNQSVLYVQDGLTGTPRVLLDPNTWSGDGADALDAVVPDPAGRRLLYSIQVGGSDWRTLRVIEVDSGEILTDTIEWVKHSRLAWARDGSGFYYARFPEPPAGEKYTALNFHHTVYFHRLGTAQAEDRVVYSRPEHPAQQFGIEVTEDGRLLVLTVATGTDDRFEIVVQDLATPGAAARVLISGFENNYDLAGVEGTVLYFRTDRAAPRQRVVAIDVEAPDEANWREVVPETTAALTDARLVGGTVIAEYLEDAHSVVRLFALDGTPSGELELPGLGTAEGFDSEQSSSETFFAWTSFDSPTTIHRLDIASRETTVFRRPVTPFDPAQYVVSQAFYASKDGTRVPMFIAYRRDLDLARGAPTLLYGYGGFNIPLTPAFSVRILAWMEMGGVWASANLRGGGEYGKAWHDAGRLLNKQNVFDDFIAAAEYLVARGITTPAQLAVHGGSNGGLLVGAVINQRPELFAAALPAVGVMDMLRFDRFSAGRYWVDDYGVPAAELHFRNLLKYSPYHNIRDGLEYPAVLVTTADTDDRVIPGHSFKYIAALQAANAGNRPRLIRIATRAGHGAGTPTDKQIAEAADQWVFAAAHTGLLVPGCTVCDTQ